MAQNIRCYQCQGNFDGQDKIPTILPCEHNICALCAFDQFQKNKIIKCFQQRCQKIHKINPLYLQKDTEILKHLETKELHNSISLLESQQASVKTIYDQLVKQKEDFTQQLMKHIDQYIFKDSLVVQKDLEQVALDIKQQLNYLTVQLNNLSAQQQESSQQFQQQNFDNPQLSQRVQKLQADVQRVMQSLSQVSTSVYKELADVRSSLAQVSDQSKELNCQVQNLQKKK